MRRVLALLLLSACASAASGPTPEHPRIVIEEIRCYVLKPVPFEKGSARLVDGSADVVSELASTMTHDPANFVFVEASGFASDDEPDAVDLSRRRAEAVRDALVAKGVDAARLRAKGYGAYCPISARGEARYPDRRVETRVVRTKQGETGVELGCEAAADAGLR